MAKKDEVKTDVPVENEVKPEVESEFVQIKKTDLDEVFKKMDKYQKDIDLLYKASDKSRLAKAQGNGKDVLIHTTKVSRWDNGDKYVIAWKLDTNRSEIINGKWIEDQQATVILDDAESVSVPLLEFYRKMVHKDIGDIIGREKKFDRVTDEEYEILKVEFKNGRVLEINSKFVN